MDRSFELLFMLVLAIFVQTLFLEPTQFMSSHPEPEILAVVPPQSAASLPPSAFLNQGKEGGACAAVPFFSRFPPAKRHLFS
jgi:hypothetical protein